MGEDRIVKSNFLMKITTLKKIKDAEDNDTLKVVNEEWVRTKGKDFIAALYSDRKKGVNRKIEYVSTAPKKFQIGVIYILLDGTRAWVYKEESL